MDEKDFEARASATLEALERALENCGDEIDFELKAGGILEIEFDDGSRIIVNRHGAAREIWVADRSGGFHFRPDGDRWRDTRDGTDLFEALARLLSRHAGRSVSLE